MIKYKTGCMLVVAGVLTGCASPQLPCDCQPTKTVYVPVPVKVTPKKPVAEKPIITEKPEPKVEAVPLPPKKPNKLQKLREDIKRLKDEYLHKKPTGANDFRG